jgi:hypothetical protein
MQQQIPDTDIVAIVYGCFVCPINCTLIIRQLAGAPVGKTHNHPCPRFPSLTTNWKN